MEIFVCIKQVPDTETKIQPNDSGDYIVTDGVKWIMNPYDEFAVEQAIQIKAANPGSTITAIRVGGKKESEALRTALAMGVDNAIHVEAPDLLDSYATAKAIKTALEKGEKKPDLILAGKQAIDTDAMQVPQILAAMLNYPSVSVIVSCEQNGETFTVKREIDGGALEVYETSLPAVFACNKGLNTPRYASLPGIMKAKRKPITEYSLQDLGMSAEEQKITYQSFSLPPEKPPGKKFTVSEGEEAAVVSEVVKLLREEAKVI